MVINILNCEIINSNGVYIHDDILEEMLFNRTEKKLHLSILKAEESHKIFCIDFLNVIGFEMTSCDFWGASPHILDFEYVEECDNIIIPKLFEQKKHTNCPFCSLLDQEKYFETIITFTSGDWLRIACESIVLQ